MRLRYVLVATSASLALLDGCSSDDTPDSTNPGVTAAATPTVSAAPNDGKAPTACETDEADEADNWPTVTIDVDDDSDGLGRFGLRTPNPLQEGTIRLVVNSVEDNPDPVTVTVTSAGATVFEFVQVEPGVLCPAVLELPAGDYTVTFGDKTKTITVDPAP